MDTDEKDEGLLEEAFEDDEQFDDDDELEEPLFDGDEDDDETDDYLDFDSFEDTDE